MKSRHFADNIERNTLRNLVYKVTDVTSHDGLIKDTRLVEKMTYSPLLNITSSSLRRHLNVIFERIK